MDKDNLTTRDKEHMQRFVDLLQSGTNDMSINYDYYLKYRRWCSREKDWCLEKIAEHMKLKTGVDIRQQFGLPEGFSMSDLPDGIETSKKDAQLNPLPFNQEFYEKLMACAKIRIAPTDNSLVKSRAVFKNWNLSKSEPDTKVLVNWLAGKVDGQLVLFKEIISYPIAGTLFDATNSSEGFPNIASSYELKAILGGDERFICELIRADYNPISPHRNFMREDGKVLDEPDNLFGSHVHIVNDKFNCAFPSLYCHSDAKYLDIENGGKRMTFAQISNSLRNALNVRSRDYGLNYPAYSRGIMYDDVYSVTPDQMEVGTFVDRMERNIKLSRDRYADTKDVRIEDVGKFRVSRGMNKVME